MKAKYKMKKRGDEVVYTSKSGAYVLRRKHKGQPGIYIARTAWNRHIVTTENLDTAIKRLES